MSYVGEDLGVPEYLRTQFRVNINDEHSSLRCADKFVGCETMRMLVPGN